MGLLTVMLAAAITLSILSPYFLNTQNLLNVGVAISFYGIVAAATTIVLISGGLDLSIAAVMALSTCIVAATLQAGQPVTVAIALALAAGALVGMSNGWLTSYSGINPFVVTVGSAFLVRGLAYLVTGGAVIAVQDPFLVTLGQGKVFGIPYTVLIMIAAFAVCGFLLQRTIYGRHWFAVGGTTGGTMARLAGVPVRRRMWQVYLLSSLAAATAGVLIAGYTTVGDANGLLGSELAILAGVILGGTALSGGRGTMTGTVIGVVLVGIISNGIQLLNLGISAQYIFLGGVLLLAVSYDQTRRRREIRG
ncbi:MAG: hypothetical protein GC156_09590 [Actinomycetales bacterium]|nr:hypothetical protein [Actinomycetales bacterium]